MYDICNKRSNIFMLKFVTTMTIIFFASSSFILISLFSVIEAAIETPAQRDAP